MANTYFMDVLDSGNNLLKETTGFCFFQSLAFNDEIEQLATTGVLHDQEQLSGRLDDLIRVSKAVNLPHRAK